MDLLCGTCGAVAGFIFSQHCDIVSQTALQIGYYAVILIGLATACVTLAAHHGGVEVNNVTR